ncbi:MAG TPA: hypothetical protein PLC48_01110 [Ferruginibacter sp.]|nr:hypothetical protein [Ferruginibacter sp.]
MDSTDFNAANEQPLYPERFALPPIKTLKIKIVDFKAPDFKNIKSSLSGKKQAAEISIITDTPIPARAASPILYLGNNKTGYYKLGEKKNEYLFYAFDFEKISADEPIGWGWNNDLPENIQKTSFQFKIK